MAREDSGGFRELPGTVDEAACQYECSYPVGMGDGREVCSPYME